ncbi:MAG: right-handed parallel beta-helix repeat-containing protein [Bacteroidetes bacterium]|jgi:hypothetical protein|nr:right-handed parallel beta-helix repeat-containing protein [Bacteroidota bacterium]
MKKKITIMLLFNAFLSLSTFFFQTVNAQNCNHTIENSQLVVDGDNINPGDTICVLAGVRNYLLLRNIKGTDNQPVVIINHGNVIIDTDHFYGLKMSDCQFIKMIGNQYQEQYGFNIQRVGNGAGITLDDLTSDIELAGFEIAHTALGGIYAKTDPDCSFEATRENFTFHNLSIHNCYLHDIQDEGFYIGSSKYTGQYLPDCDTTVLPHLIENVEVYNNLVVNTGWDGIQVSSSIGNCLIYNNKIYNDSWRETVFQMSGILIGGGSNCDCFNNQVFDGKGDGIDILGTGNMSIYNNLIVRAGRSFQINNPDESRHGIFIGNAADLSQSNFRLLHNTIISPKTSGIRYLNANTSFNLIANNIITDPGAYDIVGNRSYFDHQLSPEVYEEESNLYTRNNQQVNFIDLQEDNYDLQANSPAVNTAADLGNQSLTFDVLMRPRPHNQGYDKGAFESQDPYASRFDHYELAKNDFQICPLPAVSFVQIKFPAANENKQIKLLNTLGTCVFTSETISADQLQNGYYLSLRNIKSGAYMLILSGSKTTDSKMLILSR